MPLKQFTTTLQKLSQDEYLRNDEKFHYFLNSSNWNLFDSDTKNLISLKYVLEEDFNLFEYEDWEEYKWIPTWQGFLDEDWEVKDWQVVTSEEHPWRLKYKVTNKNILISSLRLAKNWAINFENTDLTNFVFSNWFYIFNVKKDWNERFILYILKTKKLRHILDNNIYRWIWISTYKKDDLLKIKIPNIPKSLQDQLVSQIEPIEEKIRELKATIKSSQDIINKVFARDFGFDLEKFEELKKSKNYSLDFFDFWNNKDIRQSVKFHRKAWKFILEDLAKITNKKIKDFINKPIVLGSWVSPNNYDENWDYYYISMANIKNWRFETDGVNLVSKNYSNDNQNKTVAKNDILIARSGEWSIGKVAIIEDEDIQGIFADFIIRIRLSNYNSLFAYYYFRTEYFQYLVEINKKWLWNNTNIFPSQIWEFPLIDIDLDRQQLIVDEIKAELDKQEEIKRQIEAERGEIDKIIEKVLD